MRTALRATCVVFILRLISVIAQTDVDTLKAQGRLLAQLVEPTPFGTSPADIVLITQPAEVAADPITAPPQTKPGLLTSHKKWIFIGVGSLCAALISVLIAQWASEVIAWKRQKRKLAQDEACRRHVEELYSTDIESPTKPAQFVIFKDEEAAAPPAAPSEEGRPAENSNSASSPTTTTTATGIRLPASVMLRRAPSLRSNLSSIAIRRSSSSREGTPRSPLGRRHGGLGLVSSSSLRRANSSRNPSSMCGSPRSLDSKELTVDISVKLRDVKATGWAPHNHGHRSSPATSGPGTPAACGSPTGSYTLSPGRLVHRLNTDFNDGSRSSEEEVTRSNDGNFSPSGKGSIDQFGGSGQAGNNKNALIRMGTDAGLVDFRLTTSVAEDEVEESQDTAQEESSLEDGTGQRGRIRIRSTSSSGSTGERSTATPGLSSAKSIKPKDVMNATQENTEDQVDQSNQISAPTPSTPKINSPRTLALTGAKVAVLSTEEFTSQVTLLRLLGAGAAGCVHEGLWNGMKVAVKILHPSRQTSISAIEAFRKEVEVMARVGPHPGVIAVLATCLTPPNLAIIVELAEKGSLYSVLHDEGLRPRYGTLLALAEDIACAVARCHSLKLVHRDLKAHNVLLDSSGRAKVADFGLAAAKNRTFLTVEPGALGTASCMAPEQFAAHEVSERCDSYAFGCLMWELITGRQPWEECTNIMQIVMAVGLERRRPAIPPGCPGQLARLIRECWRHNPALRPGFAEIIDRIRQMKKEDGAAEALGVAAVVAATTAFISGDEGKKSRSLAEFALPYSSSLKQERVLKPGLSRLAISSS